MNVKILIAYHKPSILIQDEVFSPIHVGKANAKINLKIPGDDTGDNISHKNNIYCEMTAVYWAWKNLDADYIGLCHYRRLFTFEKKTILGRIKNLFTYLKKRYIENAIHPGSSFKYLKRDYIYITNEKQLEEKAHIFSSQILKKLKENQYSYVVPYCYKMAGCNVEEFFSVLGRDHISLLKNIVKEMFPDYYDVLEQTLNGNKLYAANMFIMSKQLFDKYAQFIFSVLNEHEKRISEQGWCQDPQSEKCYARMSGYLAELLTCTFIFILNQNKSLKHLEVNTMFLG